MKLVIDMNLSPTWVDYLRAQGLEAVHWSDVGHPAASDRDIMEWARNHGHTVFTHDLDFGVLLAMTKSSGPSVLQVRAQEIMPDAIGAMVARVLSAHEDSIDEGAFISVEGRRARVRILPLS